MVDTINTYRLEASVQDGIYREPLVLDDTLSKSEKWWAQALKGTGIFAHWAYTNAEGYIEGSHVWIVNDNGYTDFNIRNAYLGLEPAFQSENGYLGKSTDPWFVCYAWSTSPGHYSNMVNPYFTRVGVAQNTWGNGNKSVWIGVR